jgi:SHS2 domain-containing protein
MNQKTLEEIRDAINRLADLQEQTLEVLKNKNFNPALWSTEQEEFLLHKIEEGLNYNQIRREIELKFGVIRTDCSIRNRLREIEARNYIPTEEIKEVKPKRGFKKLVEEPLEDFFGDPPF